MTGSYPKGMITNHLLCRKLENYLFLKLSVSLYYTTLEKQ